METLDSGGQKFEDHLALNREHNLANSKWLERMFFSSQRNVIAADKPLREQNRPELDSITLDTLIDNQECLQWFWALWECAQFCVQSKLKTPLGKAQDTFVAIESKLSCLALIC